MYIILYMVDKMNLGISMGRRLWWILMNEDFHPEIRLTVGGSLLQRLSHGWVINFIIHVIALNKNAQHVVGIIYGIIYGMPWPHFEIIFIKWFQVKMKWFYTCLIIVKPSGRVNAGAKGSHLWRPPAPGMGLGNWRLVPFLIWSPCHLDGQDLLVLFYR